MLLLFLCVLLVCFFFFVLLIGISLNLPLVHTFSGGFLYVLSLVLELHVTFRIIIFTYIYERRKFSKL